MKRRTGIAIAGGLVAVAAIALAGGAAFLSAANDISAAPDMVRIADDAGRFELDRSPVTVGQFRDYLARASLDTEGERLGGGMVIHLPMGRWSIDPEATWRRPWGSLRPDHETLDSHPVTQVTWNDAQAFCAAHGKRLPTVDEWMRAARAGNPSDAEFAVGRAMEADGKPLAKVWSGLFPVYNDGRYGEVGVVPVGETGLTPTGLTDMAGNVWNWMADDRIDPALGEAGRQKAIKGGSFLCDEHVCRGYSITTRQSSTPDTAAVHIGFRCAR
jgi:sulfatase modifying factor 1